MASDSNYVNSGILRALCLLALCLTCSAYLEKDPILKCNRKPLATTADELEPDDQFALEIVGLHQKYIPNREYTIRIVSRNNSTTFIAFTIWIQATVNVDPMNSHKPSTNSPGEIRPDGVHTKKMPYCPHTVMQTGVQPKTITEVRWRAPDKKNGCVTIQAYVAIKADMWYTSRGPLTRKVCEDTRRNEDMKPIENDNCEVGEEARYELTFEGMWSYYTHKDQHPGENASAAFSDIVGASHNKKYYVYKDSLPATEGLKMLAEQGNTTKLEMEILENLGTNVRTVIKASAPKRTDQSTVASFRANRDKHLISLVTSLMPSPDWFLGVNDLELCDVRNNSWAENIILNLYPLDAGTDSGKNFTSPNEVSAPPKSVSQPEITKNVPKDELKPFARITVKLVRTYFNPNCTTETEPNSSSEEPTVEVTDEPPQEPPRTSRPRPTTPAREPDEDATCPEGYWEDLACEAPCVDGMRIGLKTKIFRLQARSGGRGRVRFEMDYSIPESCNTEGDTAMEDCEEECDEEIESENTADRQVWGEPVKPGQNWKGKK